MESGGMGKPTTPALRTGREPARRPVEFSDGASRLWVVIPYTTPELTRAALSFAAAFGQGLGVCVQLIDVQVVPYPCPLSQPMVSREHSRHKLRELARQSGLPVRAELVYARDQEEGFRHVLRPASLVLLATSKRWWRTAEEKLARSLSRAGHSVAIMPQKA
jgi:hypothetical protein